MMCSTSAFPWQWQMFSKARLHMQYRHKKHTQTHMHTDMVSHWTVSHCVLRAASPHQSRREVNQKASSQGVMRGKTHTHTIFISHFKTPPDWHIVLFCFYFRSLLTEIRQGTWGPNFLNLKQTNNPDAYRPCSNVTSLFFPLSHRHKHTHSVSLCEPHPHMYCRYLKKTNFRWPLALKHWKVKHKPGSRNKRNMSV